jgi:hypothetical protein
MQRGPTAINTTFRLNNSEPETIIDNFVESIVPTNSLENNIGISNKI